MIGYQDKIHQILRGAETIKNMNDDIDLELSVSVLTKTLKDVQLERDEAIRLATLFQALYLRYGKAEDESYSTLLVKKGFESLANLKGLGYFGEKEA